MKKQIYFISAFLPSFPGGAEKSILEEFKKYSKKKYNIKAITFDCYYKKNEYDFKFVKGKNYKLNFIKLLNLSRFLYFYLNKKRINNRLYENLEDIKKSDFVIIQGVTSPEIANFCIKNKIKYNYYLRDNTSINFFPNYNLGLRKHLKNIKSFIEFPLTLRFKKLNKNAILNANRLIGNSDAMAKGAKDFLGVDLDEIIYPKIDIDKFKGVKLNKNKQKYITLIGGRDSEKGFDMFFKISKLFPKENFLVVEKRDNIQIIDNVTYVPWAKDVTKIYEKSKIITSISRWSKTFSGRIGIEASYFKIPVISSAKINFQGIKNPNVVVLDNIDDLNEWEGAIKTLLKK